MSASDLLARLRHDLGKAIGFQRRWLPDPSDEDELRAALVEDLLRTRRSGDQVISAVELWTKLRTELRAEPALAGDPELAELDDAMATIEILSASLAAGASGEHLRRAAAAADRVTELCRGWWARRSS